MKGSLIPDSVTNCPAETFCSGATERGIIRTKAITSITSTIRLKLFPFILLLPPFRFPSIYVDLFTKGPWSLDRGLDCCAMPHLLVKVALFSCQTACGSKFDPHNVRQISKSNNGSPDHIYKKDVA